MLGLRLLHKAETGCVLFPQVQGARLRQPGGDRALSGTQGARLCGRNKILAQNCYACNKPIILSKQISGFMSLSGVILFLRPSYALPSRHPEAGHFIIHIRLNPRRAKHQAAMKILLISKKSKQKINQEQERSVQERIHFRKIIPGSCYGCSSLLTVTQ